MLRLNSFAHPSLQVGIDDFMGITNHEITEFNINNFETSRSQVQAIKKRGSKLRADLIKNENDE